MRKRGEIEEWLKKIFFGGRRSEYIVFIRFREGDESILKPIPGELITDVRNGFIFVGEDQIPFHRVVEIRLKNGVLVFKRGKKA